MDPTLTKSEAHRVFGDLYRKLRSPELQQEVDEIVSKTSDIFVRIAKIEELDEREKKKNSIEVAAPPPRERSPSGVQAASKRKNPSVKKEKKSGGFLGRILGGELARWGSDTATIKSSMFGMKLSLNPRCLKLFSSLKEDQIVGSIKAFRIALSQGWQVWAPAEYNTVMAAYQFLNEFVKMPSSLKNIDKLEMYIHNSLKLQKLYSAMISYPSYEKILSEDFIAFTIKSQGNENLSGHLKNTVLFLLSLESKAPQMKSIFRAFYSLSRNKLVTWQEIMGEIGTPQTYLENYRAPENVLSLIMQHVKKLKEDIRMKTSEAKEVDEIQRLYFTLDDKNRIVTTFLDPICKDMVKRNYPENLINENFIKNQKSQPIRLLYLLLRDMDLVVSPFLGSPVNVKAEGGSEAVVVFKSGLFKALFEEVLVLNREVEVFIKKNNDFIYSFKDFHNDSKSGDIPEGPLAAFFGIIKKANQIFSKLVFDLKTVMDNHRLAVEKEGLGSKGSEKLVRTKSIPIEGFEIGMRYIPFQERIIVSSDRLNGKRVSETVKELIMNFYNYLYIYRDHELIRILSSSARIRQEISDLEKELARMGITAED